MHRVYILAFIVSLFSVSCETNEFDKNKDNPLMPGVWTIIASDNGLEKRTDSSETTFFQTYKPGNQFVFVEGAIFYIRDLKKTKKLTGLYTVEGEDEFLKMKADIDNSIIRYHLDHISQGRMRLNAQEQGHMINLVLEKEQNPVE